VLLEKRLRERPGGAPYALGTSSPVTTISSWLAVCARTERLAAGNIEHAHIISGRSRRPRSPEKKQVFLINTAHHYKIVMNGKTNFFEKKRLQLGCVTALIGRRAGSSANETNILP
jgi:hypothetical protein